MKKAISIILFVCIVLVVFRGCTHKHEWQAATCTEPEICSVCKDTQGDPLGHDWLSATCTARSTCSRCGAVQGSLANHQFLPATCTEPEMCAVCGKKAHWYSLPLSHDWQDATCTTPKTCALCGLTDGGPEHFFISYLWDVTVEPTCQAEGEKSHACTLCGEIETQAIPTVACTPGDWAIVEEASPTAPGVRIKCCTMCGAELEREEYVYTPPRTTPGGGGGGGTGGSNFNTYDNEAQQNTSASYVLNRSTMKFHRPSCRDVPKISPANYATSSSTRSELISLGYDPCGHCSP